MKQQTAPIPPIFATAEAQSQGQRLAEQLHTPLLTTEPEEKQPYLKLTAAGLALTDGKLALKGDFTTLLPRLKQTNLERELLVKAAHIKGLTEMPTVIDATAGLGEDSLLLAAAGFRVTLCEYDPVIAALLADALRRGIARPELAPVIGRMTLYVGDSIAYFQKLSEPPHVIYLDPMFPERRKSALVKKKFQLLQQLEYPCNNEAELLTAALQLHPRKIIIKRPLKGPYLAGRKPSHSFSGKAVPYDCIVLPPKNASQTFEE